MWFSTTEPGFESPYRYQIGEARPHGHDHWCDDRQDDHWLRDR